MIVNKGYMYNARGYTGSIARPVLPFY